MPKCFSLKFSFYYVQYISSVFIVVVGIWWWLLRLLHLFTEEINFRHNFRLQMGFACRLFQRLVEIGLMVNNPTGPIQWFNETRMIHSYDRNVGRMSVKKPAPTTKKSSEVFIQTKSQLSISFEREITITSANKKNDLMNLDGLCRLFFLMRRKKAEHRLQF